MQIFFSRDVITSYKQRAEDYSGNEYMVKLLQLMIKPFWGSFCCTVWI